MSLGSFPAISLAEAREAHMSARTMVAKGLNPLEERRRAHIEHEANVLKVTQSQFETVAASWMSRRKSELRLSTLTQISRELKRCVEPKFNGRDITTITRPEITELLLALQLKAPETARNVRGHLHNIFEHAIDTGVLEINPTPPGRVLGRRRNVHHHPALPARELGALLRRLDKATTIYEKTRVALLLVILTAARKREVTSARWDEIDLRHARWQIPAARMKAKRPHLVPLSRQAVTLLKAMKQLNAETRSDFVFPHRDRPNKPMEGATLNAVLTRMGYRGLATPHGMRATFSTHFNSLGANPDVIERCLAHDSERAVRSAYNRHHYEDERREVLQKWADFLDNIKSGS